MGLVLIILLIGEWGQGLSRPLWSKPPAGSTNYYFDPYPPDEILPPIWDDVNEDACCCCCLFTGVGTFLGYKFFKEKPVKRERKKLSVGVSYSLGSAGDGIYPEQAGGGYELVRYDKMFYFVNSFRGFISYNLTLSLELNAGFGYLWGVSKDRESVFNYITDGDTIWISGGDWEISAYNPGLSIRFLKKNMFLEGGFEWYFAKGINYAYKRLGSYPYQWEEIKIIAKGMSPGGFLGFGFTPNLSSFLHLEFAAICRYGYVNNPDQLNPGGIIRTEDFALHFLGIYLRVGLRYNLLSWKGEER